MSTWYYIKSGEKRGPVFDASMHEMVAKGELDPENLVWKEGMTDWQRADAVGEFKFPPRTTPPPAPNGAIAALSETSGKAVASMILSILGISALPLIGSIIGLILGYGARTEIKESEGKLSGDEMATAGIVLGWIGTAIFGIPALIIILVIIFAVTVAA